MSIIFLFLPQKCLSWCHLKTIYTHATRRSSFPWVHTLFQINEDLLVSFLKLFVMHHGHNYQSFLSASPISCGRLQANLWMNHFLRVSLLPAAIVNSYATASMERWETQEEVASGSLVWFWRWLPLMIRLSKCHSMTAVLLQWQFPSSFVNEFEHFQYPQVWGSNTSWSIMYDLWNCPAEPQ